MGTHQLVGTLLLTNTPLNPIQGPPGVVLTSTKKDLSWSRFSKTLGERVSRRASLRAALSADSRAGWGSWGRGRGPIRRRVTPQKGIFFGGGDTSMSYLEQLARCLPKIADDALQGLPLRLIGDGVQVHGPWGWGWSWGNHGGAPQTSLPHGSPS